MPLSSSTASLPSGYLPCHPLKWAWGHLNLYLLHFEAFNGQGWGSSKSIMIHPGPRNAREAQLKYLLGKQAGRRYTDRQLEGKESTLRETMWHRYIRSNLLR
eukprot:1161390-Pelagomonas_calceolata.AAC.3